MFKWVAGLIDRLFAVCGALTFSQIPLFMQQYQHHLAGHVAELQTQIQGMKNTAALTGKSLQQYVIKFLSSEDMDFRNQGELMNHMIQRYQSLLEGHHALKDATLYSKPFLFIKYFDWSIGQFTWQSFDIGFSFTLEGGAYALLGMLLGFLIFWILRKFLRGILKPFPLFKNRKS